MDRSSGFCMPAEWAPREATLISWPVRREAWLDGLEEAREGYVEVINAIADCERVILIGSPSAAFRKKIAASVEIWDLPHDDSWIRDNGPTIVMGPLGTRAGIKWHFNAWGEKYQPFDADDRLAGLVLDRLSLPRIDAPLVLEGGSIHVDGEGSLLSTRQCLLAPNRNPSMSQKLIEGHLCSWLGVENIIWLDQGLWGDETDGHVDNVACFVRPGLVLIQLPDDPADPDYAPGLENRRILRDATDASGHPLEVVSVKTPARRQCRGENLTLSYVNYYPVTGAIVLPVFGRGGDAELQKADDAALGLLSDLYPDRKIIAIDGMKIIKGGGNVHCITQQIPASRSS